MCGNNYVILDTWNKRKHVQDAVKPKNSSSSQKTNDSVLADDRSANSVTLEHQVGCSRTSDSDLSTNQNGMVVSPVTSRKNSLVAYLSFATSVREPLTVVQTFIGSTTKEITQLKTWLTLTRVAMLSTADTLPYLTLEKVLVRLAVSYKTSERRVAPFAA